jgi:hypothetical protein
MIHLLLCLLALAGLQEAPKPAPPEGPPGQRFQLTDGQLFIPEGYRPGEGPVPLTLHLHGAAWAGVRNLVRARQPGVAVTVVLPGLSSVYTQKFRDPAVFQGILEEARTRVAEALAAPELKIGPVTVTSFSAGFGGVRELLKDPEAFERIDALVMADSIYAGFAGEPAKREVDPAAMEGFLRFTREAAEGRKRMIVSHTQLPTPTYASTVETADYLLRQLGGEREAAAESWPSDLALQSRFRKGQFQLYGFAGETGPDHMKHLHNLWLFLERLR